MTGEVYKALSIMASQKKYKLLSYAPLLLTWWDGWGILRFGPVVINVWGVFVSLVVGISQGYNEFLGYLLKEKEKAKENEEKDIKIDMDRRMFSLIFIGEMLVLIMIFYLVFYPESIQSLLDQQNQYQIVRYVVLALVIEALTLTVYLQRNFVRINLSKGAENKQQGE